MPQNNYREEGEKWLLAHGFVQDSRGAWSLPTAEVDVDVIWLADRWHADINSWACHDVDVAKALAEATASVSIGIARIQTTLARVEALLAFDK